MKLLFFFMNKNILNYLKLFVINLPSLLLPYLFNLFVLIVYLFIYYLFITSSYFVIFLLIFRTKLQHLFIYSFIM